MPNDSDTMTELKNSLSWIHELSKGQNGPHATIANTVIVFGHDPALACVAYDDFGHTVVMIKPAPPAWSGSMPAPGPYPRQMTENDVTLMQVYIQRTYDIRISDRIALQAALQAADCRHIHPVRDWLNSLEWDGVPRLHNWMQVAFGAPGDTYHEAIGIKVLCAAVRRARKPGCKFDYVVVLHGAQGLQKSTAIRELFGEHWFTDNLPHDLASKDAQQAMAGKWGVELAELNVLVKSTSQAAKAFFSRQVDYFRPPYGKVYIEQNRQCIFIGTTNEDDFLSDTTGNRRYWPVHCVKPSEIAWIREVREQLWAEAAHLEAEGETLWLDDSAIERKAEVQQTNRTSEDVWAPRIMEWLAETLPPRTQVHVAEVLHNALNIPPFQQNRSGEMRVASVMRGLGWVKHRSRIDGRNAQRWFAPGEKLSNGTFVPEPQSDGD